MTTAAALTAGVAGATPENDNGPTMESISETPPPAVEDYYYPGADQIFSDRGIRLIQGDGNIVLVDCTTDVDVIRVDSVTVGSSCYQVIGERGWLTMEIPRVYLVQADDHNVAGRITVDDEVQAIDLAPGEHTPVGESDDGNPATLIELHAS
ncbi:hypothetical protein [Saccharomonospora cyanea]|uniref:hypothetical protein n=1 Tax=Saccharomonospora cyanea TaxID=40989 RepID=UPI0012FAE574|nr:hypothetical protein [Saccharomonospora cyanea]